MRETNISRSRIYGENPHDVYSISYKIGSDAKMATFLTPNLTALEETLGEDDYIPQTDIEGVISDLEKYGQTTFTDDEKLTFSKAEVTKAIKAYDSAEGEGCVNNFDFVYGGKTYHYWFNMMERIGLGREAATWAENHDTYTVDDRKDNISFTVPCALLAAMLKQLAEYAIKCYNNTSVHKMAVAGLKTVEEVTKYDYTTGYPENLTFKIG